VGDEEGFLRLLDQTRLPCEVGYLDCRDTPTLIDAIRRLVVRGAPAIGVAGGYGVVLAAREAMHTPDFAAGLRAGADAVASARPTAVNLAWAARRVLAAGLKALEAGDPRAACRAMLAEARRIHAEDRALCLAIGSHAAPLVERCEGVLTHCNAGALATAGVGTATAGMYVAHARGHRFTVYCDETRPLLQGSRLTAWELSRRGIDAVVIADNMAAQVLREGRVQMVVVGADRIAANGDTANKIGTYGLAVLALRHGVPFYVAAPYSTFDLSLATGADIPIEQRSGAEITHGFGRQTGPDGIRTYNPAFDVTPAELIAGIITDRGIVQPVTPEAIRRLLG
jgi:methylthioribose-1-phosphate isomerase